MRAIHRAAIIAASLSFAFTTPAFAANEYPVDPGEYVEVSGITVDDGHDLEYLNYLAGTWRSNHSFRPVSPPTSRSRSRCRQVRGMKAV